MSEFFWLFVICDRDAIVRALESGKIAGYAGDVWFPQPPQNDHPWRTMPHHGMTPHIAGNTTGGSEEATRFKKK